MLRRFIAAVGLLMALVVSVPAAQAMKGYELYSWKVKGRWHYAVLTGTNRDKSYDEITAKASERIGIAALTGALKRLPRGETLVWRSAAHAGVIKPQSPGSPVLELPSRHRIERIRAICEKLGLRLTLS